MGYYSEVAIKCEEKAFKLFEEVFSKKELYVEPDHIYKDGDDYIIHWDWIKWYDGFEGVDAITDVMETLNDNTTDGYGYRFMRLGEDDNDTETMENDYDIDLWMIRKIDIPDGLPELKY